MPTASHLSVYRTPVQQALEGHRSSLRPDGCEDSVAAVRMVPGVLVTMEVRSTTVVTVTAGTEVLAANVCGATATCQVLHEEFYHRYNDEAWQS